MFVRFQVYYAVTQEARRQCVRHMSGCLIAKDRQTRARGSRASSSAQVLSEGDIQVALGVLKDFWRVGHAHHGSSKAS